MVIRKISEKIIGIGAIDWDRRIFDELVPTPEGTSYNSYLVKGSEKTVLIDTVDPSFEEDLITNLIKSGCDKIDAIITHHAEQDHSGSLPLLLELFPGATIYCTEKCSSLLQILLDISSERIHTIKDGETYDLGGLSLEFIESPWVHWPETMMSYCPEEKILFSCDLFGSHYATSSIFMSDPSRTEILAKRYYAEIMMPFRNSIRKYMERISSKDINIIAPSHGPLYQPSSWILNLYKDWVSDEVKNCVLIPYVSMHHSTERMVRTLTEMIIERGIEVKPIKLSGYDVGLLAMEMVDAATIIFATPTVLFGPHPEMVSAAYLTNLIKPKTRYYSVIGSQGWGGKTVDTLKTLIPHLNAELLNPVYITGAPNEKTRQDLDKLANLIAEKHSSDEFIR